MLNQKLQLKLKKVIPTTDSTYETDSANYSRIRAKIKNKLRKTIQR